MQSWLGGVRRPGHPPAAGPDYTQIQLSSLLICLWFVEVQSVSDKVASSVSRRLTRVVSALLLTVGLVSFLLTERLAALGCRVVQSVS